MIARYLSSVTAGLVVTTALLWVMNTLIEIAEDIPVVGADISDLVYLPTLEDSETAIEEWRPEPVDPPVKPPPLVLPTSEFTEPGFTRIPAGPAPPEKSRLDHPSFEFADGALVNIIQAQPEYPISLAQKGIEGYVIVQFNVNARGQVENVQVVESAHKGFNKAAVKAAYRSRYKPQVVDGVPQVTYGLQKMFRFEMEI